MSATPPTTARSRPSSQACRAAIVMPSPLVGSPSVARSESNSPGRASAGGFGLGAGGHAVSCGGATMAAATAGEPAGWFDHPGIAFSGASPPTH